MIERCCLTISAGLAIALLATAPLRAEPSVFPTDTTRYDPGKAYNSFVLFTGADDKTHLIDMDGKEVHRWDYSGHPSVRHSPAASAAMSWLSFRR